jgi:hypothetical protein
VGAGRSGPQLRPAHRPSSEHEVVRNGKGDFAYLKRGWDVSGTE